MTKLTRPVLGLLASAAALCVLAVPTRAQVPAGHVAVSSATYSPFPGFGGIYFVDPFAPFTVTPVTGLPCELTGTCSGSIGANCVLRDPRTEQLISGSVRLNSGPTHVFAMTLSGSTVTGTMSAFIGNTGGDGGVNGAALLPNGDCLLAVGPIASGPAANRPLMRWTPATNALVPVQLPPIYYTGNFANAVTMRSDGQRAIAALRPCLCYGVNIQIDVVEVDLVSNATTLITQLPLGEFVSQFSWGCGGELVAVTGRFPFGTGGRVLSWVPTPNGWGPMIPIVYPSLRDYSGIRVDPASCTTFLTPQVLPGPPYHSHLYAMPSGSATPALLTTGPIGGWGLTTGIDVNPNPEVTEDATAAPNGFAPRWSDRPFPGGRPLLGTTFSMQITTGPTGAFTGAYLSLGKQAWTGPFSLQLYLDPTSMNSLGSATGVDPAFTLSIPNSPTLLGLTLYGQAAAADTSGAIGATELLSFTIV